MFRAVALVLSSSPFVGGGHHQTLVGKSGTSKLFDASVTHVKELVAWVEKNWA